MVFYDANGVHVDEDFARFGSKSYAIDKISSLDMRETLVRKASKRSMTAVVIVVAAGAMLAIFGQWTGLLVAGVIGFLLYRQKPGPAVHRYDFIFVTGGGESVAYATQDPEQASAVRVAIESAISGRRRASGSAGLSAPAAI